MKTLKYLVFIIVHLSLFNLGAQVKKEYNIIGVAFYNLENLFDIHDDPETFDEDFTPKGKEKWTKKDYEKKISNMAFSISQIGRKETGAPPVVIGVCEVENREVLEDLIKDPCLLAFNYGIVHFDSPDLRGIDVALLYQQNLFRPTNAVSHKLSLIDPKHQEKENLTRDQLVVSGKLDDELIHIIVNHWPSRSGGEKASASKRESAAYLNKMIIDSIQKFDPNAKIISMGDFNDDPYNNSLTGILGAKKDRKNVHLKEIFNPMAAISEKGIGSLAYRDSWNLFDQILFSKGFLSENGFHFFKAAVFNAPFLTTPSGQYRGYPFRSFGGGGYSGGYSDHFPVYALLIKEVN